MLREFSLKDRVAIVTGAGRGIGKGIALTMAEAGADISAVDINTGEIKALADQIGKLGRKCLPVTADISRDDDVQEMIDKTIARFGRVDILVNNAGIRGADKALIPLPDLPLSPRDGVTDFNTPWSLEEWRGLMNVDLDGIFLCTRAAGLHFVKQRSGRIINIASSYAAGGRGSELNVPYCTAKAAVVRFTQALAKEWGPYHVNINAIGPGLVQTELSQELIMAKEEIREKYLARVPQQRFGKPRDIGLLAVYLAAPASSWMTGQIIYINGGETIA
ncbi:SDR family NAD(P)-dependent oxidoreductase [Chloroflexota bacterium]